MRTRDKGLWYVQSRKLGAKRWQTHVPPVAPGFMESAEVRANRLCLRWALENQQREYRAVPGLRGE